MSFHPNMLFNDTAAYIVSKKKKSFFFICPCGALNGWSRAGEILSFNQKSIRPYRHARQFYYELGKNKLYNGGASNSHMALLLEMLENLFVHFNVYLLASDGE